MKYVLARPCSQCEEEAPDQHDKHELSYLMDGEKKEVAKTKIFYSRQEAKDWLSENLPIEYIDEIMLIPLPEVPKKLR